MSKYLTLKYLRISKKYRSRAVQKIDFWWVHLGRFPGGGSIWEGSRERGTPSYVKIFVSRISTEIKKSLPQLEPFKKSDFLGPHFGEVPGKKAQTNFGRQNCVCSSTTLPKNSISMFCGLGEKERTRVKKKKRKKQNKRKKELIAAKTGLVEMKKYLKTYYRVKYFFAVLKPFLNATAFYAKLSGRFSGPETEET